MEDNKNLNYDQEDRNYTDAPATTDFEKSKLNNDPNQGYQNNPEQFEEFSGDHPNRYTDNDTNADSGNIEKQNWEENDFDSSIDNSSDIEHPIYNPDDDFEDDKKNEDDEDQDSDFEDESDIEDEDLNDESDFNESDIDDEDDEEDDDEDEINNENSDLDDDWLNRKN